jgi:hypothetical protein
MLVKGYPEFPVGLIYKYIHLGFVEDLSRVTP